MYNTIFTDCDGFFMPSISPGKRFRIAIAEACPLQIAGTVNAYCARLAERIGYKAIHLSGQGLQMIHGHYLTLEFESYKMFCVMRNVSQML